MIGKKMSIFDKLAAIKEVRFEDGNITLSGQRVLIIPQEFAFAVTDLMVKDKELTGTIYEVVRNKLSVGWAEYIRRRYKFGDNPRNFVKWLIEVGAFVGWGRHELIKFDSEKLEGILRTYDAPMGILYENKLDHPVDHIWRGLTSGCATAAFQEDMDWIEIKCIAKGDPYCEFLFKPRKSLTPEEITKYKEQLPPL